MSRAQKGAARQIARALKAYVAEGRRLLDTVYADVKEIAPPYFAHPTKLISICCTDGIIVRYERADSDTAIASVLNQPLQEAAPALSEFVVYCVTEGSSPPDSMFDKAPTLQLFRQPMTGSRENLWDAKIALRCTIPMAPSMPAPGAPFRLLGVSPEIRVDLVGAIIDPEAADRSGREFVVTSSVRLNVGWEYIDIFPNADLSHWSVENAKSWAERDILAAVLKHHLRERHYRALDPNADARRACRDLLAEYGRLLDANPPEETLQQFLKDNPTLLCPAQRRSWPKIPLGSRVTDFVFRQADGDYLLVELERPSKKLFTKIGDTSSQLTHACGQVADWKRYLEDNLATAQRELGLVGISANPNALVVIGRSKDLTEDLRRRLTTLHNQTPTLKVMTYDDVLENAKAVMENIVGPLWDVGGSTEVYFLPVQSN